jgi:hypothetical protein
MNSGLRQVEDAFLWLTENYIASFNRRILAKIDRIFKKKIRLFSHLYRIDTGWQDLLWF